MLDYENENGMTEAFPDTEHEDDFDFDDGDFYDDEPQAVPDAPENDGEEKDSGNDGDAEKVKKESKKPKKKKGGFAAALKRIRLPLLISVAAVLLIVCVFFGYALSTIKEDRIMNNVYIANLDVGGLTYDEALASVKASYLFEDSEITLTDGKTTYTINGVDIGLEAIPETTTNKAMEYGKTGNIFQKAWTAAELLFNKKEIIPAPQLDDERLDEKLNECGNIMLGEWIQHHIEFTAEDSATVYSGQTGYNGDPSKVHEQVIEAMTREQFKNIHVDFDSAPPYDMTLETLDAMIYKDFVNARYEIEGNNVTVVPGETGRYIDKEAVAPLVASIYEGCEPVTVPFIVSVPDETYESLTAKLFANTLGSYSTSYGGSTWNRCQNVARAASLINGTVVAPGDVFSFNGTVGRRTKENGFYTAKEYINGESVDGIGGGTCQVSSTLYSAVLYADMGIVERLNHMMSVGYIPLGQDATVSDGGVDFKFRNTSDYPVKIVASTNGSTITVSILGTAWEPAREVKVTNNVTYSGDNTIVYSTRYVYSNGELISTDRLNSSTYMPHASAASSTSDDDDDDDGDDDDDDYDYDDDDDE